MKIILCPLCENDLKIEQYIDGKCEWCENKYWWMEDDFGYYVLFEKYPEDDLK
jgi:hypothetical protein